MTDHEFLQYVPSYAAGALGAADVARLEQHLSEGCEICDSELRIFTEVAGRIPFGLPQRKLPEKLKSDIRIRLEREGVFRPAIDWTAVFRVAAVLALLTIAGIFFRLQQTRLEGKEKEVAEAQKLLQLRNQEISWLRDPSVQLALLSGLDPAPQAQARMVWSPTAYRGVFYAKSLPQLPEGKSYQLWAIGNQGPVSAGVFAPDVAGSAVITISVLKQTDTVLQFAVTIEPAGGVPKPTGSMVLAGKPL